MLASVSLAFLCSSLDSIIPVHQTADSSVFLDPTTTVHTLHPISQLSELSRILLWASKKHSSNEGLWAKMPQKKQTAKALPPAKALLSEQVGGSLADILTSASKDLDSMNITQRLQVLKQETLLRSPIQQYHHRSTTILTTSTTVPSLLTNGGTKSNLGQYTTSSVTLSISSASTTSLDDASSHHKKEKNSNHTFTLNDFTAVTALSSLVERYGRVSHMGILDPSYSFFLTKDRQAALYYKVRNNVAVVGGDPLCAPADYDKVFGEFRTLRKRKRWGIVFLGATDHFASYAHQRKWVTMRFGTERVLNPLDNPVLLEKEQKRMLAQNRQLIDPARGGVTVHAYAPAQGRDQVLEEKLRQVYDSWRERRNHSDTPQAYMTVFNPFAIPALMTYLFTTDRDGNCNGFAALRKIGANKGYHIDPYCATADAPKGITDLLVFSAMSLLQQAGIGYLSLGFEPAVQLDEIAGLSRPMAAITKTCYLHAFRHLPIGGKKAYHDKFRPDPAMDSGLHIIYPDGAPSLQDALATLHFANIEVGGLLKRELFGGWKQKEETKEKKQEVTSPS